MNVKTIPTAIIGFALIASMHACNDYKINHESKIGHIKTVSIEQVDYDKYLDNNDNTMDEVEEYVRAK